MCVTFNSRKFACLAAGVALAASAVAAPAQADPKPRPPAPKTCPNKGLMSWGAGDKLVQIQACRGVTTVAGVKRWRGYGSIKIGPRATTADSCDLTIYTGSIVDGSRGYDDPNHRNCAAALRKGRWFTYFDGEPDDDDRPTFTRVCVQLDRPGRVLAFECLESPPVQKP